MSVEGFKTLESSCILNTLFTEKVLVRASISKAWLNEDFAHLRPRGSAQTSLKFVFKKDENK